MYICLLYIKCQVTIIKIIIIIIYIYIYIYDKRFILALSNIHFPNRSESEARRKQNNECCVEEGIAEMLREILHIGLHGSRHEESTAAALGEND